MKKKSKPRAKRKPAGVDWHEIALEVEPNNPGRRAVLEHLLVGAAAEVDRLVALGDDLNAAGSRALTEARRLIARLTNTLGTGATPRVAAVDDWTPSPTVVGFDGVGLGGDAADDDELSAHNAGRAFADDADLDNVLAQSFGGTDDE